MIKQQIKLKTNIDLIDESILSECLECYVGLRSSKTDLEKYNRLGKFLVDRRFIFKENHSEEEAFFKIINSFIYLKYKDKNELFLNNLKKYFIDNKFIFENYYRKKIFDFMQKEASIWTKDLVEGIVSGDLGVVSNTYNDILDKKQEKVNKVPVTDLLKEKRTIIRNEITGKKKGVILVTDNEVTNKNNTNSLNLIKKVVKTDKEKALKKIENEKNENLVFSILKNSKVTIKSISDIKNIFKKSKLDNDLDYEKLYYLYNTIITFCEKNNILTKDYISIVLLSRYAINNNINLSNDIQISQYIRNKLNFEGVINSTHLMIFKKNKS